MNKPMKTKKHTFECAFSRVFDSIQLCGYYSLSYNENFSNRKMKNFNNFLDKMNNESTEYSVKKDYEKLIKNLKIDCKEWAKAVPLRTKLAMYKQKRFKDPVMEVKKIDEGILLFLIFALTILHKHYRFSRARLIEWWKNTLELAGNYKNKKPLTDKHIMAWFDTIAGLPIRM